MFHKWYDKERPFEPPRGPFSQLAQTWYSSTSSHEFPLADIQDTEEAVLVQVDLPGLKRDDVKIETKDQCLCISGTRWTEDRLDERERWTGDFERKFRLGEQLDQDNVTAKLQDGVLTVTVPKQPEAQPRKIEIK